MSRKSADQAVRPTRVGLISDTHGWLDPRAALALTRAGVAAIVHAGDIGAGPEVLHELGAIAPVTAVLGNCDFGVPGFKLAGIARTKVGGARILVIHDLAGLGPVPDDVDVVVHGHTHKPSERLAGGALVVNPGSASQRRSMPSCSIGILKITADIALSADIVMLDELGPRIR